ncbi:unnamed protein product, partial [Adineta steineri]
MSEAIDTSETNIEAVGANDEKRF